MVVIAQLAEHRIVVPSVVGSSPTIHPKVNNQSFTEISSEIRAKFVPQIFSFLLVRNGK